MEIQDLILYSIILYSITDIVVNGDIFYEIRQFFFKKNYTFIYNILTCTSCFSVWLGFATSILMIYIINAPTPAQSIIINHNILAVLVDGLFSSGIVSIIYNIFSKQK